MDLKKDRERERERDRDKDKKKDVFKRGIKKLMNIKGRPHDDQQQPGPTGDGFNSPQFISISIPNSFFYGAHLLHLLLPLAEIVALDVVLPPGISKDPKELRDGEGDQLVLSLEVANGVKVVTVLKHVCQDYGLDESAHVFTFGDSDRPVHPDLDIEAVNCNEFYLKNKMGLGKEPSPILFVSLSVWPHRRCV